MTMIDIPGDYLEGGGQILRTALALSCITSKPMRIFNIRQKRPNPGLKPQHLYTLKALSCVFGAKTKGMELNSREITFIPSDNLIQLKTFEIDLKTAGSIGLALQPIILVAAFKSNDTICFNLKGGTCGLGAVPIDYYANVLFPLLGRSGLKTNLEVLKRGYYPKGGGEVRLEIEPIKDPKSIFLTEPGRLVSIRGISIASSSLALREVSQRQAKAAEQTLKQRFSVPIKIEIEYAKTASIGSEINLFAYTQNNCILGADARGEKNKSAEQVGREAAEKLIKEIDSGAGVDVHLADNLIPWLCFLKGSIKAGTISLHTQTNLWICELFLGKVFENKDTTIACLSYV